jgi:photosystem II stability/assembly factor-like uncharacterized protein
MKSFIVVGGSFLCLITLALFGASQEVAPERAKQIAEIEKQIQELQAKLSQLRGADSAFPQGDWNKLFAWRNIGPANMGGRVTSLAVDEADPTTYYVGTASGGLLKTTNNGSTFEHQFDRESTVSIGAVALSPSQPNVVWVGSGEANPRNSVSFGDGVYRSADGGKTWMNKGLAKSFQIGRIVVHPKDPKTVYVAALGRLYGPNEQRGVFKTTDEGKTWERVLFIDDKTGVIDLVMHPTNPDILIAAAWERQRDEFDSFRGNIKPPPASDPYAPATVHGAGSGLFKSTDGGKTWKKLTQGLPKAKLGRIGLDWHRKNTSLLYAVIDSDKAGMGTPPSQAFLGLATEKSSQGLRVQNVVAEGPAGKAGVAKGDVLLAVDGRELKEVEQLLAVLKDRQPGDQVKLSILRGKERKDLEAALGRRPSEDPNQRGTIGIQIEEGEDGVFVVEIQEQSAAEKAGLKMDDVLLSIDGTKLENARALFKTLAAKKIGESVKLAYRRGKDVKEIAVLLEAPAQGAPGRPYLGRLGGQRENIQAQQGPAGDDTGGVYKSVDGGDSWVRVNSLNERPFYFSVVRSDPSDEKIVWLLGVQLFRSTDGGKTFSPKDLNRGLHADHHELWINPKNGRHLLIGSDGGPYVSYDQAGNWEHLNHLSLGQFYHVAVDHRRPYHVYGGLQDNGSWGGPSDTLRPSGPRNSDYRLITGGDGFVCRVDANDPDWVYAESQDGMMMRRNLRTGESAAIRPKARPGTGGYRFNWNTPFILSSRNSGIFYCGGNYVFKSLSRGDDLKITSPEITRTKRGSATALAESPKNPDVLWAGTDDGNLWITRDGCKTWAEVSEKLRPAGLPGPFWVASIEPSHTEAGRCYVAFDAHRSNDDSAYVFVTEDYGQTWKSIRGNLPKGSTRVLREDAKNPELLYVGSEFGIHASINRGASWFKIHGSAFPTVAVHEIAQPSTAQEIVVATHGRSLWILDVSTLRQLKADHLKDGTALFASEPKTRWKLDSTHEEMFDPGTRRFTGQNPSRQAHIDFVLGKKFDKVSLKVLDIEDRTIQEFDLAKEKAPGFHRIAWDMKAGNSKAEGKKGGAKGPPNAGAPIPPGSYRVMLETDGAAHIQVLTVAADPRPDRPAEAADDFEEDRRLRRLFQRLQSDLSP